MRNSKVPSLVVLGVLAALTAIILQGSTAQADVTFGSVEALTSGTGGDKTRPNLAMGPDHAVHLVHEAADNRVAYAVKPPGGTWTLPTMPITNGVQPSIDVSPQGIVHVVDVLGGVVQHLQKAPGGNWTQEFHVSTGTNAQTPDVAAFRKKGATATLWGQGDIIVVWAENGDIYSRTRMAHGVWGAIQNVSNDGALSRNPAVAVTSTGTAYVAWESDDTIAVASKPLNGSWTIVGSTCCVWQNGVAAAMPDIVAGYNDRIWVAQSELTFGGFLSQQYEVTFVEVGGGGVFDYVSKTEVDSTRARVAPTTAGDEHAPLIVWGEEGHPTANYNCVRPESEIVYRSRHNLHDAKSQRCVSNSATTPSENPAIASYDDDFIHVAWQEFINSQWEIAYNVDPPNDSDVDGLSNPYEAARFCLFQGIPDSGSDQDNDGRTSLLEYTAGTEPCVYDTDKDGCADGEELGSNVQLGGQRNPLNLWDFMDVPTGSPLQRDRVVSVADILAIQGRFGSSGDRNGDPLSVPPGTGYHTTYDRGGPHGPNAWNLNPADGAIAVGDIQAALAQFGHNCVNAP